MPARPKGPPASRLTEARAAAAPSTQTCEDKAMCRNIKTLFNFEPPATDDEVRAAALQYVRKISGYPKPSASNQVAFEQAVDEVTRVTRRLVDSLTTAQPPKDRQVEADKARARAQRRFGAGSR